MGRSNLTYSFATIPSANIQRSKFDRSCGHKTTFNASYLIPIYNEEVLPGDSVSMALYSMIRLSCPLKVPIMDNLHFDNFWFFVPYRLLWNHFQNFMGEREDAQIPVGEDTVYLMPQVVAGSEGFTANTIYDYMGVPTGVDYLNVNSIHFRAYNLIFNEWFRDENLTLKADFEVDDGPDDVLDFTLLKRSKRHDYFTSCLPWPQKGVAAMVPIGGQAPVFGNGIAMGLVASNGSSADRYGLISSSQSTLDLRMAENAYAHTLNGATISESEVIGSIPVGLVMKTQIGNNDQSGMYADLDEATTTGMTVNLLRQAFQMQIMMEKDARGGDRYTEILQNHFGVRSPDFRLQRPEYLGGGSNRFNVNPVQKTSEEASGTNPQGHLTAYALHSAKNSTFFKSFTEHGVLMCIVNVRADQTYQYGLNRKFSRRTRDDYYWPSYAHLGEQAVMTNEIWGCLPGGEDDEVFGYQERFAEYRYGVSQITAQFRSSYGMSLDQWHCAYEWAAAPVLDQTFIEDETVDILERNLSSSATHQIIADFWFDTQWTRSMPVYSIPGFIDHF